MLDAGHRPKLLMPWEANPYDPISWWDMFLNSALLFFNLGHMTEQIFNESLITPTTGEVPFPSHLLKQPISDELRANALKTYQLVVDSCSTVGMPITVATAEELIEKINGRQDYEHDLLISDNNALRRLMRKEMMKKVFLYMTPERAAYWPKTDKFIFGDKVMNALPSAGYDINEASACIAMARGTAAVFHLMRAMEIALGVLAAKFSISIDHTNWQNAIDQIEKKIGQMGQDPTWKAQSDWKDQQELYSQAISHLRVVKDAWRNYTAHARGKFTEEEAQDVYRDVKRFMQTLAERLKE
ncbi:MAG: hypothetical protein WCF26_02970 [Candidatus Sulfotelmatobacter sp.]